MQNFSKNWYIVYTMAKREKKVAELLAKKRINYYCPHVITQRLFSHTKKFESEPLFSSYVFVWINEDEQFQVRQTEGVINFVYWLGKPAVISDEEIEHIKQFLVDYSEIRLEKTFVNLKDHVRILSGPLLIKERNVLEVKNNSNILTLPSLGYTLVAEEKREKEENISNISMSEMHEEKRNGFISPI